MDRKYQELVDKKAFLDNELKNLEKSIFDNETKYLEDTAFTGNVIKGWDGYLSMKNTKANAALQRKSKSSQNDRIFSLSSKTSPFVQEVTTQNQITNPTKQVNAEVSGEDNKYHFRRTKKKKYAGFQKNDQGAHTPQSSSDEYQAEKKIKISKKI
ncbi:unnamed protein product (macronuclear) [Paramecium tetraurelia]|uniref:Chromatin modification-related protein MEAF6 n=1 Tax=Paramecium tetraurelia TaxID=5888 RepID=A0C4K9_PARTE|nr:uncharacterized protein GSPATT00006225001 [Paramecium tetraurelia]CAK65726.1 unnamed protein product [Paramecium tetraurelia]|eukprot:XP_001433123.1 hypothetical protein (macronuclear) [Paramecium tetraurelia strain d4-2]